MTHVFISKNTKKLRTNFNVFDIFQDPSVQQAVAGTGTKQANLEDYQPFDAQKNTTTSGNNAGIHFLSRKQWSYCV